MTNKESETQGEAKEVGIDRRNESVRRYRYLPKDTTRRMLHGGREAEVKGSEINSQHRENKVESDAKIKSDRTDTKGSSRGSD
jgi:hypothetical protein